MGWTAASGEGKQTVTVTVIVGLFVAVLGIVLFLSVADWVKIVLVLIMSGIGLLNYWAVIGGPDKFRRSIATEEYERGIQRYPELVRELLRLDKKIHEVLYERRSDQPSLALTGADLNLLVPAKGTTTEFSDKLQMLMVTYTPFHQRIVQFSNLKPKNRRTTAFWQIVSEVSAHLGLVHLAFTPLYEGAKRTDASAKLQVPWQDFVTEYNAVLTQWKTFVESMEQAIHSGAPTGAVMAKPLPSSVR